MVLSYRFVPVLLLWAGSGGTSGTHDPNITRAQVDLIELNHFLDENGREVFQQVIFYDWCKVKQRFHVRAWRLIKHEHQLPTRRWKPKCFQCTWHDGPLLRQVHAPKMRETWSREDPERVNRKLLPEDQRIPLFPARARSVPDHASGRSSENATRR